MAAVVSIGVSSAARDILNLSHFKNVFGFYCFPEYETICLFLVLVPPHSVHFWHWRRLGVGGGGGGVLWHWDSGGGLHHGFGIPLLLLHLHSHFAIVHFGRNSHRAVYLKQYVKILFPSFVFPHFSFGQNDAGARFRVSRLDYGNGLFFKKNIRRFQFLFPKKFEVSNHFFSFFVELDPV